MLFNILLGWMGLWMKPDIVNIGHCLSIMGSWMPYEVIYTFENMWTMWATHPRHFITYIIYTLCGFWWYRGTPINNHQDSLWRGTWKISTGTSGCPLWGRFGRLARSWLRLRLCLHFGFRFGLSGRHCATLSFRDWDRLGTGFHRQRFLGP